MGRELAEGKAHLAEAAAAAARGAAAEMRAAFAELEDHCQVGRGEDRLGQKTKPACMCQPARILAGAASAAST